MSNLTDDETATARFAAGMFIRGSIRRELGRVAFEHPDFSWHEEKHFGQSLFIIRGPVFLVHSIYRRLQNHFGDH